jgi:hypothetical protein
LDNMSSISFLFALHTVHYIKKNIFVILNLK